jgi:phage I-like protein
MASATRRRIGGRRRSVALSFLAIAETPPTEFRIFAAGKSTTSKGEYIFDEQAARDVMAAYEAHGADLMIDLEHLSVSDPDRSINFDPDARGWAKLELRNGELWAVQVSWTPDGLARLTERRQRYVSPCFAYDPDTLRITEILNVAITSLPATDNLEPLIAASRRVERLALAENTPMTQEEFQKIAEVLELGADASVEDVIATLTEMVNKLKGAANGESPSDAAEEPITAAVEAVPAVAAARKLGAAARALVKLSGKKDIGESIAEIKTWHESHLSQEQERAKLAKDREVLESSERRRLVGSLVALGNEIPATAWEDPLDPTVPAEPWKSMPMDKLRARVAKLTQAKGSASGAAAPRPAPLAAERGGKAVAVNGETVELSAREVTICEEQKVKLEDYAANKLIRLRAQKAAS